MNIHIYIHMCVYVFIYIHMHIYICSLYMYILRFWVLSPRTQARSFRRGSSRHSDRSHKIVEGSGGQLDDST